MLVVHVRPDEYSHFSCLCCLLQWSSDALLAAHSSHRVNQGHEVACSVQSCMSEEALNGTEMMYWGKNAHPHF